MRPTVLSLLACLTLIGASCGGTREHTTSPCPATCNQCDATRGCLDCTANTSFCTGATVTACNADGTVGAVVKTCDTAGGETCSGGSCLTACDVAAGAHSYIGCDYWPVSLLNAELDPLFDFAVAVANPLQVNDVTTSGPANVKIVQGDTPCDPSSNLADSVAYATVPAGQVQTILLPWVSELSQNLSGVSSVLSSGGAYHLCSSLPVTVYQFNPLEYQKPSATCASDPNPTAGQCHSYTNDASLLLPTSALQEDYIVSAYQTYGLYDSAVAKPTAVTTPGYFAVVATQNGTNVTVTYTAHTAPGVDLVPQMPGDKVTYQLDQGDVLQIASAMPKWDPKAPKPPCVNTSMDFQGTYCDLGPDYNLTGTRISADKPVSVFGGHSCAFVPYDKWACDHLEQQLIPLTEWGSETIAVQTPPSQMGEPNVFRVMSGSDATTMTFDPPVHATVTLDTGAYVELTTEGGFHVTATAASGQPRLQVAQYMVGGNYIENFDPMSLGDPSLGLAVPVAQYRKSYDFLTPETYTQSAVTIIGKAGSQVTLDSMNMSIGFNQMIGSTDYAYEVVDLDPGAHHVTSDTPFGITVSGVAPFTSYMFPGGLNLFEINPQ